jgi:hypothetical protein
MGDRNTGSKSTNRASRARFDLVFRYRRKILSCLSLIEYSSERSLPCEKFYPISRLASELLLAGPHDIQPDITPQGAEHNNQ